jgi:integrase
MTVYRHKGSPYYHFEFQFRGQRFHGSTKCTSKREAQEFERRQRVAAALPSQGRPPITVDLAAGLYTEHAETLPSWPTIRYMLAALVKGLGPRRHLTDVTQRDLQVYFARRRNGRSNATVNREVENARALWRHADRTRFDVGEMPDWRALRLRVADKPPRELDQAGGEEAALFAALDPDVRDAMRFLLLSGWRRGEVLGLRWSDLDLPGRTARTRIKGGNTVTRALTTEMVVLLANQPRKCPQVFTYLCRQSRAKRRKGQRYPLTATVLRDRFQEARTKAKLKDFRIHDLRHTRGTRILRATQNLAATQKALAHKHIRTTLRYAHVLLDDVRNALEASESRPVSADHTMKGKHHG